MYQRIQKISSAKALSLGVMLVLLVSHSGAKSETSGIRTYADLAPILAERCIMCHSGDSPPAGLRLDSFDSILKGSRNGAVVKTGNPAASELIKRLRGNSQPRMPMTGPPFLSDAQIAMFENWITSGLKKGEVTEMEAPVQIAPPGQASGETVTYLHVAPIFAKRCARCHTEKGLMGPAPEGYRLTSYEATLARHDRVRVVPGAPDASELIRRIRGQARPRMPFDGPPYLTREEIQLIEDWILQGARNAEGIPARFPTGAPVRLHGMLTSRWYLDNLPLGVGARTRIDKSPAPGDYIEVRGHLGEDASVNVSRLRRR